MTRPLQVYVAAASTEIDRARSVMDELRFRGAKIVGDWTGRAEGDPDGLQLTEVDRAIASDEQLLAMRHADVVLLLVPVETTTVGAWVEIGCAWANRIPVIASYPGARLPFMAAWAFHELTDADAITRALRVGERVR